MQITCNFIKISSKEVNFMVNISCTESHHLTRMDTNFAFFLNERLQTCPNFHMIELQVGSPGGTNMGDGGV